MLWVKRSKYIEDSNIILQFAHETVTMRPLEEIMWESIPSEATVLANGMGTEPKLEVLYKTDKESIFMMSW